MGHGGRPVILPSFVIAGAPRCGTTSLHYYLRQHPQICMSTIKEPNVFLFGPDGRPHIAEAPIIRKSVKKLADYAALFRPTAMTSAIGEASPLYLYTHPTPAQMLAVCGVIQVLCVLRRPADRAWSHFLYAFPDVPADDRARVFAGYVDAELAGGPVYEPYRTPTHLVRLGRYGEQVRRYQETFGAEHVQVLLTEDLAADRAGALGAICRHVGVDDGFTFDLSQRYNPSSSATMNPVLRRVVRRVAPTLKAVLPPRVAGRLGDLRMGRADATNEPAPPIDPEVARRIADWCAEDVDELAGLIGRDLSAWHSAPAG
ncbi:MAG: sulfotransferase [Actinomycetia bacterium]|nr:sulfotransferase [Actinomycetes bacterium]